MIDAPGSITSKKELDEIFAREGFVYFNYSEEPNGVGKYPIATQYHLDVAYDYINDDRQFGCWGMLLFTNYWLCYAYARRTCFNDSE